MQLKEYLQANNIDMMEFSRKTGFSYMSIYNWCHWRHVPLYAYQLIIARETKGKVTQEDWKKVKITRRNNEKDDDINKRSLKTNAVHSAKRVRSGASAQPQGKKSGR